MSGITPQGTAKRFPSALSSRNLQVLAFMRSFFEENDQLPPSHVIAAYFGFKSANAANLHAARLVQHGLLERNAVGKLRFVRPRKEAAPCQ